MVQMIKSYQEFTFLSQTLRSLPPSESGIQDGFSPASLTGLRVPSTHSEHKIHSVSSGWIDEKFILKSWPSKQGGPPCLGQLRMSGDYRDKPGRLSPSDPGWLPPALYPKASQQVSLEALALLRPHLRLGLESWVLPIVLGSSYGPGLGHLPTSPQSSRGGLDVNPCCVILGKSSSFSWVSAYLSLKWD